MTVRTGEEQLSHKVLAVQGVDLSSDPQHTAKTPGVVMCTVICVLGRQRQAASWPSSLTESVRSPS